MRKPKNYDEKILQCLKNNPSTYEELGSGIGLSHPSKSVRFYVRNLLMNDKVRAATIRLRGDPLHPLSRRRTFFYLPGEEKLLGEKVTQFLPSEVESEKMRKRINKALKDSLPEESFDVTRYYVRLTRI